MLYELNTVIRVQPQHHTAHVHANVANWGGGGGGGEQRSYNVGSWKCWGKKVPLVCLPPPSLISPIISMPLFPTDYTKIEATCNSHRTVSVCISLTGHCNFKGLQLTKKQWSWSFQGNVIYQEIGISRELRT